MLESLVKMNRPPTDQEKEIILEYMAPTIAKLKVVQGQVSKITAHIEVLKCQLQRLQDEEAAILNTLSDHCLVFSPFRNLPDDILREICVASVQDDTPELSYGHTPMPYVLGQICSGMRRIALTTPRIWASMSVNIIPSKRKISAEESYPILARRAIEWFERSGGLALTVIIQDARMVYEVLENMASDPTNIVFDALLSYSPRWKEIHFTARCRPGILPAAMLRIAALTADDVPLLHSVSLRFANSTLDPVLDRSELLRIPTLRHVTLERTFQMFTVNWAILTSVTLCGVNNKNDIGNILQQTKCLKFCDITLDYSEQHYAHEINLPFLTTLIVSEKSRRRLSHGTHSILKAITAPILGIFEDHIKFFDLSLLDFLKRSPQIWKISLLYFNEDKSLTETMELLRQCPSLTILSLQPHVWCTCDADQFLRSFVEQNNHGVICPYLQDFSFSGEIDFSIETLHIFLQGKHGDIAMPNVWPWRRVVINIKGVVSTERHKKIADIVSKKQAAGLDVHVYSLF